MDNFTMDKFTIVTISGSTKFKDEILKAQRDLSMEQNIVLMCPIFQHAEGLTLPAYDIDILWKMHLQRIEMCDTLYVVNKDGYIGESTLKEIEYAKSLGKNIKFMEDLIQRWLIVRHDYDKEGFMVEQHNYIRRNPDGITQYVGYITGTEIEVNEKCEKYQRDGERFQDPNGKIYPYYTYHKIREIGEDS